MESATTWKRDMRYVQRVTVQEHQHGTVDVSSMVKAFPQSSKLQRRILVWLQCQVICSEARTKLDGVSVKAPRLRSESVTSATVALLLLLTEQSAEDKLAFRFVERDKRLTQRTDAK